MRDEYSAQYGCELEVEKVEALFQVGITLLERGSGKILRPQRPGFQRNLTLAFDGVHYTLSQPARIPNRSIHCPNCRSRHSSYAAFLNHRHKTKGSTTCSPMGTQIRSVGGGFDSGSGRHLWVRLAAQGITVAKASRFPPFFAVYDFETRFERVNYPLGEKGSLDERLVLVSFAVATNLPAHRQIVFDHGADPGQLFNRFWQLLLRLQDQAAKLTKRRWRHHIETLKRRLRFYSNQLPKTEDSKASNYCLEFTDFNRLKLMIRELSSLVQALERFIECFPVLGFNSANFDLFLVKKYIARVLVNDPNALIIKAGQSLKCIQTRSIRFLDISQYLAPGYSLKKFLHAYLPELKTEEVKGSFPYEWLTSWEKLGETREFPPHSAFHSTLRGENISEEEYAHALTVWHSLPSQDRSMLTYLEWYNKLDVQHLLRACEVIQAYWVDKVGRHPFRQAVSLPGLALRMAYKRKDFKANILLPTKQFSQAQEMMKKGFVGGPAIVFLRYSEVGKTRIKEWIYGNEAKAVGSVVTYDLNSLYLWAMSRCPMPCDSWTHYTTTDGINFTTRAMHRYFKEEMEWLAFRQAQDGVEGLCTEHHILHQWNGGPVKLGNIPVDGFCAACRSVYMYDGARFHGPCPKCPPMDREPDRAAELDGAQGETLEKRAYLRSHFPHLNFHQICSCEWTRMKLDSRELRKLSQQVFPKQKPVHPSFGDILGAVESGDFFGALEVDIHVPHDLVSQYDSFPPFFCNKDLCFDMLSPSMADMGRREKKTLGRRLVSTLEATNFVVISPLLEFYLSRGFVVSKIHQAVRMTPRPAFHKLGSEIFDLRCAAINDPSLQIQAETAKLIGNSAYGKTCERKEKHCRVRCVGAEKLEKVMSGKRFMNYELLDDEVAETSEHPAVVFDDTPKSIGVFIVGYAKLQILRFAYMLMDFCDERDWSPVLMDTDSLCLELSVGGGDLDSIIRPEKREEWARVRSQFLPCGPDVREQKRLGIFKVESLGDAVVALGAKSYAIRLLDGQLKTAAKGISKRLNKFTFKRYKDVLDGETESEGINRGFRKTPGGELYRYCQRKVALTSFYAKRVIAKDNINTHTIRFPSS